MSILDRLLAGGGVVLLGSTVRTLYKDAQETKRRKSAPLRFDDGLTQDEFNEIVRDTAKRTPRVADVVVTGMTATLHVASLSGLSTWKAEIDFNDHGHLTGAYWVSSGNPESLIPRHFAEAVQAEITGRVTRTAPER